jgi:flagellar L-ring protein precursor FlgH
MLLRMNLSLFLTLILGACSFYPQSSLVTTPTTMRPSAASLKAPGAPVVQPSNGSIFVNQPLNNLYSGGYLNLYGDRGSSFQQVGDILSVHIEERTAASSSDENRNSYSGSVGASISSDFKLPVIGGFFNGNKYMGAGAASNQANNAGGGSVRTNQLFNGSISVTVIEVLENGNLLVSGEKQVRINSETDIIRISGVVNPKDIRNGNNVSSTRMADVRLEQMSQGYKRLFSEPGWLSRIFLSIKPF